MNIQKIAIATGVVVLSAAAVFAAKKPFGNPVKIFWVQAGACAHFTLNGASSHFTTGNMASGVQASINRFVRFNAVCSGGVASVPVYFHP